MECESQKGRGLLDLSQPCLSLGFVDSTVPTDARSFAGKFQVSENSKHPEIFYPVFCLGF